jgi:membrane associated rhomboid family serine protease
MAQDEPPPPSRGRFAVPWPVIMLVGMLLAVFAVQSALASAVFGPDAFIDRFGFRPSDLTGGRPETVLTAIFLHGGWRHVLVNALFLVVFGSPVARQFGVDGQGAGGFFAFFLICGLIANLGYAVLDPGNPHPVIGASGAVAGLMGAASVLIWRRRDATPVVRWSMLGTAAIWLALNLAIVFGLRFGVRLGGWALVAGGAPIAWQSHLVGFAAGLLLLRPAWRLLRRRQADHVIEY